MNTRTKLIIGALTLATLLPTGSLIISTDAAARPAFIGHRGPPGGFWSYRLRDKMPVRSGGGAAMRSVINGGLRIH
jgi:hypothetical protein